MTSRLLEAIPVLPSLNVQKSLDFWKDKMGFETWGWENPPTYGGAGRDGIEVHYFPTDRKEVCTWTSCRITVDDLTELHEKAQTADVIHPKGGLADQPWGYREFTLLDPDGVCIVICQELKED